MRVQVRLMLAVSAATLAVGCVKPAEQLVAGDLQPSAAPTTSAAAPLPSPSASPSPSLKPSPKPTTTLKKKVAPGGDIPASPAPPPADDGVPASGAGTFAIASGGTAVIGLGATLVKYRIEVEDGIDWGDNPVWTPAGFAEAVDDISAHPRGWIASAQSPITYSPTGLTDASWSFQRVSGADFSVAIRLATPDTVDKLCGQVGLKTQGVYSCRFGDTIMINLRRWLRGAAGFPMDVSGYRHMVIYHEVGHFLGFYHMKCPGSGKPGPVMQTQTIALNGCKPNPYPFGTDGTFISGP